MKYKDENGNWIDIHVKAIDNEPLSSTKIYFGTTEPNGYKFANGQELSRTKYAELFKVIGTNYGSGDGSTTFNLPNMNGRVPVGLNVNQEWFNTLGKTGGSTELQEHSHNQTMAGFPSVSDNGNGEEAYGYIVNNLDIKTTKRNITNTAGTGNAGNLQPYITVNYIIKVKNLATLPPNAELIDENGTPSDTNTYNANAIKELVNNEVTLFEGILKGNNSLSKDFTLYKRLLVTYSLYDHPNETANNAGTSGIAILDLSSNVNQMYSVSGNVPYNMLSSTAAGNVMGYFFRVNKDKKEFYCRFHYKGDYQDNNEYYYVSKIVGIK